VDKLATKIIEIGGGQALMYPGNYEEFLWSKKNAAASGSGLSASGSRPEGASRVSVSASRPVAATGNKPLAPPPTQPKAERPKPKAETESYEERKRRDAEARKARKAEDVRRRRIEELEARIAERETEVKKIEAEMSAPGFYDNHEAAKPVIDRHQALMWEVGDLMGQWEALQEQAETQN
jgi:ATP-binding cassette subfamily F protein 3